MQPRRFKGSLEDNLFEAGFKVLSLSHFFRILLLADYTSVFFFWMDYWLLNIQISFPNWIITGASHQFSQLKEGVSRLPQHSFGMTKLLSSVIKLQRWWRFLHSQKVRRKSAVLIQRHIRGLFARRRTFMERHYIVMIQVIFSFLLN